MTGSVIVSVGRHELDELKPLWKALYDHQSEVAPHLRDREVPFDQAWSTRREIEKQWMASEPASFVLAARAEEVFVGYAFVRVRSGAGFAASWTVSDPIAELATLAVLPAFRRQGLGSVLMDEVHARLQALGVGDLVIGVVSSNADALRFYRRRGAVPFLTELIQPVG